MPCGVPSDTRLYAISQQLRLLARRNCVTAADGRLLGGAIDPWIEALRQRLLLLLETIQDGRPLFSDAAALVAVCEQLVDSQRGAIRSLRRQCA